MGLGGSDEAGEVYYAAATRRNRSMYTLLGEALSGLSILVIMWGGDLVMGLLGVFVFPTCPRSWKGSGRPSATLVGSLFRGGCVRDAML